MAQQVIRHVGINDFVQGLEAQSEFTPEAQR